MNKLWKVDKLEYFYRANVLILENAYYTMLNKKRKIKGK